MTIRKKTSLFNKIKTRLDPNLQNARESLLSRPEQFENIRQRYPELANAIQRNDLSAMAQLMSQFTSGDFSSGLQNNPMSNEFDLENQKRIAEEIRYFGNRVYYI